MSAPPAYSDNPKPAKKYGATPDPDSEPLLPTNAGAGASGSSNAWMDQPSEDDLPDDFKIGVNVIDCDAEIRLAFIRKVYSILFIQLLATAGVSVVMSLPQITDFMQAHGWIIYIPFAGSFASLLGVYWKRHQHPANLILLGLFTMFEAMLVGTVVSYYESRIVSHHSLEHIVCLTDVQVLQALFITMGVFFGLTLFTFQTRVSSLSALNNHKSGAYVSVRLLLIRPIPLRRYHGPPHRLARPNLPPLQRKCRFGSCLLLGRHFLRLHPLRYPADHEAALSR